VKHYRGYARLVRALLIDEVVVKLTDKQISYIINQVAKHKKTRKSIVHMETNFTGIQPNYATG
jgi:hypothetical protein